MFKYFSHQGDIQMAQIGIGLLSYLIASVIAVVNSMMRYSILMQVGH